MDIAQDGLEGVRKARSGFFHLVLCDIRMPGLDGLMTIQHIQEFQEKAGMGKSGFIVITAYESPESRSRAFQLGVSDFLLKPFDLKHFREVVDHNVRPIVKETPVHEVEQLNRELERLLAVFNERTKGEQRKPKKG